MPERDNDPIANTQMFRAFVQRGEEAEPAAAKRAPVTLIVTIAAIVVIAAAVVVWLVAS